MEAVAKLKVEARSEVGSGAVKKLRREGLTPGVLYGGGGGSESISVREADVAMVLEEGHRFVELELGGERVRAVIREVQYDALGDEVIHADFHRVVAGEKVKLMAEVILVGECSGLTRGGILEQPLREIELECPAESLVESIEVDISEVDVGQHVLVSDMKVPAGVRVLVEGDSVVASVSEPKEEEVVEEVVEEKEPELVTKEGEAEAGEEVGEKKREE